jgi:hypothetical protein
MCNGNNFGTRKSNQSTRKATNFTRKATSATPSHVPGKLVPSSAWLGCDAGAPRHLPAPRHAPRATPRLPARPNKRYYNTPSPAFCHLLEADPFLLSPPPPTHTQIPISNTPGKLVPSSLRMWQIRSTAKSLARTTLSAWLLVMLMCSGVCSLQGVATGLLPRPPSTTVAPDCAEMCPRFWSPVEGTKEQRHTCRRSVCAPYPAHRIQQGENDGRKGDGCRQQ